MDICVFTQTIRIIRDHVDKKKEWLIGEADKKSMKCIVQNPRIAHPRYLQRAPDSTVAKCVNKNRKSPRFPDGLNRVDVLNRHRESYLMLENNVRTTASILEIPDYLSISLLF